MDLQNMENNKWLWQPDKKGSIFFRFEYYDVNGEKKRFVRSLKTRHWPDARKIRDSEFTPIIYDMEKAKRQLDFILEIYPQLEEKLKNGIHGAMAPQNQETLISELVEKWQEALRKKGSNYETAESTASRYEVIAIRFIKWADSNKGISEFTAQDIINYRDARLENDQVSKNTVELELGVLKRLFSFAVDKFKLKFNPANGITVQRTHSEKNRENRIKKRRPPTHEEADATCSNFPPHKMFSKEDFEDYSMFARYTGMRQAEISHLCIDDFIYYNGKEYADVILANPTGKGIKFTESDGKDKENILCIYVKDEQSRETKTGLERIIPVSQKLLPVAIRRIAKYQNGPIFPCAWKENIITFGRTYLKKIKGISADLTMHGFRHYAASEMENNGIGVNVSCAVLGHAPERVHGSYLHINIQAMKDAVDKIY